MSGPTLYRILSLILLCLIFAQLNWGSKSFEVDDPTKPTMFTYHKWPLWDYSVIILHSEGDIRQGSAVVKVYDWDYKKDTLGHPILEQKLRETVDKTITNDYYDRRAYIVYQPKNVVAKGTIKLTITIK